MGLSGAGRGFIAFLLTLILYGCSGDVFYERGLVSFYIDDSTSIVLSTGPVLEGESFIINNSDERLVLELVDEGVYSIPVFGGSMVGEWVDKRFCGVWTDSLRLGKYQIPIEFCPMSIGEDVCLNEPEKLVWETTIGTLVALVFCDSVKATFLTPTGDYRYLSGSLRDGDLKLMTFDGAHLFYFSASLQGDSLVCGVFKSGSHYTEEWGGVAINKVLPHPSTQCYDPNQEIEFSATNSLGEEVVYSQKLLAKSGKKLMVVDVLGSWCPNCLDEVRLMRELVVFYPEVEFVSVSFERGEKEGSLIRLAQFKEEIGMGWELLYGGVASKGVADSVLPFLGGVGSFPTTAFIPADGSPVIHTGFNGPATGELYEKEVVFFRSTIESMLKR